VSDEKKLIVDEDWKSKVQREKEEARLKAESAAPKAAEAPAAAPAGAEAEAGQAPEAEAGPEAAEPRAVRFNDLLGMLASQALYALGAMPAGDGRQVMVDLDQAKFLVELLNVLEEKTRGNLSTEEAEHLHEARGEIGRIFAVRLQQVEEQAMRQAGIDPGNLKNPGGQPG